MNKDETMSYIKTLDHKPKLLLHACCAPCTTGMYKELSEIFDVTIFYYNPNTYPKEEYELRYDNLKKLSEIYGFKYIDIGYDDREYFDIVKGHENDKEGEERCYLCYELRLKTCALFAKNNGFDLFTSTLSVSPYKNAEWLNEIGNKLETEIGIRYLYSDFKKKDGYKNSIKRSKELGLYRQEYCGCMYSLNAKEN